MLVRNLNGAIFALPAVFKIVSAGTAVNMIVGTSTTQLAQMSTPDAAKAAVQGIFDSWDETTLDFADYDS